ncbi:MAG TPA: hypothetical protein DDZ40_10155 [Deltaproteobacteria bacterium]|nr:hypothetical protein [Deltaproteobacteria bacterium]
MNRIGLWFVVIERRWTYRAKSDGRVPCIWVLRITVATVVEMVADGMTNAEILTAYPDLEEENKAEALRFAAEAVAEREHPWRWRREIPRRQCPIIILCARAKRIRL